MASDHEHVTVDADTYSRLVEEHHLVGRKLSGDATLSRLAYAHDMAEEALDLSRARNDANPTHHLNDQETDR